MGPVAAKPSWNIYVKSRIMYMSHDMYDVKQNNVSLAKGLLPVYRLFIWQQ